jgi:hypothetical protein
MLQKYTLLTIQQFPTDDRVVSGHQFGVNQLFLAGKVVRQRAHQRSVAMQNEGAVLMFKTLKMVKMTVLALSVFLAGFLPVSTTHARDATIQFEVFKAGFIVGVGGGSGTLFHKGKGYRLSIGGVSLGATIGASRAELIGNVYNLKDPRDIVGTYSAVGGSAVLGGGASIVELTNSRGVRLNVSGRSIGLELSMDLSGLQISMR